MRRPFVAAISAALLLMVAVVPVAAGPSFTHATGDIRMAAPLQFAEFNAFDYGATGDRGTFKYANFEYPAPGSGVWLPVAGTYTLTTALGGSPFVHTMTIDTVKPISTTTTLFSGTGFYNAIPSYTWTVTGSIAGSIVSFHILYTGTGAGYWFDAVGPAGSMSGPGTDSLGQSPLTWTLPAGFAHEVLSYSASVTCAVVTDVDATFGFRIPAGFLGLSGLDIVVKVHDGGTPGTNGDTYGHAVAPCGYMGTVTGYTITAGNLVVH